MCSLSDAYSHDDGWKGNLEDTIAAGAEIQSENDVIIDAIKVERPFMSEAETAVADWMIAVVSGADGRKLVQLAADRANG